MYESARRFLLRLPWSLAVLLFTALSVALSLLALVAMMWAGVDFGAQTRLVFLIGLAVPLLVAGPVSGLIVKLLHEVQEARDAALKLAWRDELTTLYNRRRFLELGRREFDLCRRGGRPLVGALMDLDNFKRVNDVHGHAAGDEVLRVAGRVLAETLRSTDLVCRWGGEEFAFLLPDTNGERGLAVLERVVQALRLKGADVGGSTPLIFTASIGMAVIDDDCPDITQLISRADTALYGAKQSGKNRVALYAPGQGV